MIHRFTAKKISEALENNYWYTGIVIKDTTSDTLAMVHADKEAKRIYIRIKGTAKLGMWEYIRRDLANITTSYAKIVYEELVAVDENIDNVVSYEDLTSYIQSNKPIYFHPKLKKDFNLGYLIGLFESKEGTIGKVENGTIAIKTSNEASSSEVPSFVINILNNNNPIVNTHIDHTLNIDINIELVNKLGSDLKGDAAYLLGEIDGRNKKINLALNAILQFAEDSKQAINEKDIKEKGWARKLKSVLDNLGQTGEQFKNIHEGKEAFFAMLKGVKELAVQFKIANIPDWLSNF